MSRASALVLVSLTAGCVAKDFDAIEVACTVDAECPDDAWCDLPHETCYSRAGSGPPHLVMDGISIGGAPPARSITVPVDANAVVTFRLRNDGASQATTKLELAGPQCLGIIGLFSSGELLDPGEVFEDDLLVEPDPGCMSPSTMTFTMTASGRPFTFPFEVVITP